LAGRQRYVTSDHRIEESAVLHPSAASGPGTPNGTGPHALLRSDRSDDEFRLAVVANAHGTVVVAHGELDIATAPELEAAVVAQTGFVVADLREVSFADGSAMQALLRAEAHFRLNGDSLAFIPGAAVRRTMGVVGLTGALTLMAPPGANRANGA